MKEKHISIGTSTNTISGKTRQGILLPSTSATSLMNSIPTSKKSMRTSTVKNKSATSLHRQKTSKHAISASGWTKNVLKAEVERPLFSAMNRFYPLSYIVYQKTWRKLMSLRAIPSIRQPVPPSLDNCSTSISTDVPNRQGVTFHDFSEL